MQMSILEANNISVRYGNLTIIDNVSFSLEENQWLMVVGPNGAGKSTLVNAVSQYINYSGRVLYAGCDIKRLKPHELARNIGILSQSHSVGYDFTVGEVVRLGRYAYAPSFFSSKSKGDDEAVAKALQLTGLTELVNQSVLTLSGGELQRTFLAQVLAQDPKVLILDEPTNHLDLVYQKQIFNLISEWMNETGRAAVSVVHDLSLARAFGTHAILLHHGKCLASGRIEDVFVPENLNKAFLMDIHSWMHLMYGQWEKND